VRRFRASRISAGVDATDRLHLDLLAALAEVLLAGDPVVVGVEVLQVARPRLERGLRCGLGAEVGAVAVLAGRLFWVRDGAGIGVGLVVIRRRSAPGQRVSGDSVRLVLAEPVEPMRVAAVLVEDGLRVLLELEIAAVFVFRAEVPEFVAVRRTTSLHSR
jgi:hypothetical protein